MTGMTERRRTLSIEEGALVILVAGGLLVVTVLAAAVSWLIRKLRR